MGEEVERIIFVTHPVWPAVIPRYPIGHYKEFTVHKHDLPINVPQNDTSHNRSRRTPVEVKQFIDKKLLPTIHRIKGNFIIIAVPTPPSHVANKIFSPSMINELAKANGFAEWKSLSEDEKLKLWKILEPRLKIFFRVSQRSHRQALAIEKKFFALLEKEFPKKTFVASGTHGIDSFAVAREVFEDLAKLQIPISKKAVAIGVGTWAEQCAKNYSSEFAKLQGIRSTVARKGTISLHPYARPPKKRLLHRL